ncbi:hypothetical protein ASPZODRAFT_1231765 [Penicilliopsis zonata CBS 506.65]|uniref:Uncharacterized protein n=1 Tax=Penicilliopsis zonata CBS 506.65 TaxID=1073090 RepID=A0A1L9S6X6_9EURO|nr:hypothetical protein ASPZODRAFT_1231765 [Penicilliopsis zonata CBS 506.65]OJJ42888.1 hypothetical protein ASPZODRAFT_1231765 [Penicilliopsis zonata CBS 506.65]
MSVVCVGMAVNESMYRSERERCWSKVIRSYQANCYYVRDVNIRIVKEVWKNCSRTPVFVLGAVFISTQCAFTMAGISGDMWRLSRRGTTCLTGKSKMMASEA